MTDEVYLVTGANGEIGHGLVSALADLDRGKVIALDLQPIEDTLKNFCFESLQGDVLDEGLLRSIVLDRGVTTIFHLASILSTKAELNPELAQRINVEGTINLLKLANEQSKISHHPVKFIYPSSIAVYGMPSLVVKQTTGKVREDQFCQPVTMYGCNKLYCEHLGRYYSHYYRLLTEKPGESTLLDFRAIRFPGLISAFTVPTGGTSDYGPEMIHHAAQGLDYACFVRPDAQLPFMVMPDAIKSILNLAAAPRERLGQTVYNVTSFSPTAQEIFEEVKKVFPHAGIHFKPSPARQGIVDSWPADIDDSAARNDWDWRPDYDQERAFSEYLIPAIQQRYSQIKVHNK